MKSYSSFILVLLLAGVPFAQEPPQEPPVRDYTLDYTRVNLPEGAAARLGMGAFGHVAFSPDGLTLAISSPRGVWLYDVRSDAMVDLLPANTSADRVRFSPDGTTLVGIYRYSIQFWNVESREEMARIRQETVVSSVAFSPNGATLVTGGIDGSVRLWDVASGEMKSINEEICMRVVSSVAISADSAYVAAVCGYYAHEKEVRLWFLSIGTVKTTDKDPGAKLHPDGSTFAAVGGGRSGFDFGFQLRDAVNNKVVLQTSKYVTETPNGVAFSPGGERVAFVYCVKTSRYSYDVICHVNVVDVASGNVLAEDVSFGENRSPVDLLALSPDGATLAIANSRQTDFIQGSNLYPYSTLEVWDVSKGEMKVRLSQRFVMDSLAFSPDGLTLAGSDRYRWTVRLWDVASGEEKAGIPMNEASYNRPLFSVLSFSPDGATLAGIWYAYNSRYDRYSQDGSTKLWDVASGEEKASGAQHFNTSALAFSPDGATLATGGNDRYLDGNVRLWDVASGELKVENIDLRFNNNDISKVSSLAFSPDGATLAVGGDEGLVILLETSYLSSTASVRHHNVSDFYTPVTSLSFSPDGDGATLASGGTGTVRLWDLESLEMEKTVLYGPAECTSKPQICGNRAEAFSPDGALLAAVTRRQGDYRKLGNSIQLWDVTSGRKKADFNGHSGEIASFSFSPDGLTLASASHDQTIILWDLTPYIAPEVPTPDFDGDGTVGFSDFVQFAAKFGLTQGDPEYDARFDLDGDGAIGFSDFVIIASNFGQGT